MTAPVLSARSALSRVIPLPGDGFSSFGTGSLRHRWGRSALGALIGAGLLLPTAAVAAPEHDQLAARATAAMARAAAFFRDEVAVQGSYGWRYSADLAAASPRS